MDGTPPRPSRKPQPRAHRCRGGDVLRRCRAQDRARQLAKQVGRFVRMVCLVVFFGSLVNWFSWLVVLVDWLVLVVWLDLRRLINWMCVA